MDITVFMQLSYFDLESMRTVAHNQDLLEHTLRVRITFTFDLTSLMVEKVRIITFIIFFPSISGGGFKISPLKSRNGKPRTQVQHLMQIDLKGWLVGHFLSFRQHALLHTLNSVAGVTLLKLDGLIRLIELVHE